MIITVFFHNYYGDDLKWLAYLGQKLNKPFSLFYNRVANSYHRKKAPERNLNLSEYTPSQPLNSVFIRDSTNLGKDVGGKLVLLDAYLKLGLDSDYFLFLHDKQSPHHAHGKEWKDDLYRIVEHGKLEQIFTIFENDPTIGIVASKNAIRNELDNDTESDAYVNSSFIKELKIRYNISPPDLQYAAGTMFWVRSKLMQEFFEQHPPLLIRASLEGGDVMDNERPSLTHAWERLLSWLVTGKGYKIKGI